MNKKRKYIIFIILVIIFVLVGFFVLNDLFSSNISNLLLIGNKNDNIEFTQESNNDNVDNYKESLSENKEEVILDNDDVILGNSEEMVVEEDNNIKEFDDYYSEEEVVSYFEKMGKEVQNSGSFKEKFKEYFITTIDFIFYDKVINGYTFNELSNIAKIKIISIALKIDSKIEEYIPNYKENISSTSNRIYTNVKEKLVTLYMDIATDICSGDNEDECDKAKLIFGEIKKVCKIGWNFIKGLFSDGVTKVREWYEIYSGK